MTNDSMEKMYIKYHRDLYLYAFSLCKDHHFAQDLTSETFYKAYLSLDDVDYFKYWLFRVCKNLYIDTVKRRKEFAANDIEQHAENTRLGPLEDIIRNEDNQRLYREILSLNASYKEVLILYYFCDFSIKEIGVARGIKEGAAKTLLFRARKTLKKKLEVCNES